MGVARSSRVMTGAMGGNVEVNALCTVFGAKAVELIAEDRFGQMVAYTGPQVTSVNIFDAVGKLRTVPLDGGFVQTARA